LQYKCIRKADEHIAKDDEKYEEGNNARWNDK
jgi:hypothetical protein